MKIPFSKYHGAGNDFVIIDSKCIPSNIDFSHLARLLCHRQKGVGADGLIVFFSSAIADYKMRIFNADGSEPAMCGNGIRCLFDLLQKQEDVLNIETLHGVLSCCRKDGEIAVNLGVPKILHWPIKLPEGDVFVVDTGVPHAVLFVDELDKVNVSEIGTQIRFAHDVNVNFVSVLDNKKIALRTYERGIEGETLACGTGAAAAAFVAMKQYHLLSPVSTLTRSSFDQTPTQYQQYLRFQFHGSELEMYGNAIEVFQGVLTMAPMVGDDTIGKGIRPPMKIQ